MFGGGLVESNDLHIIDLLKKNSCIMKKKYQKKKKKKKLHWCIEHRKIIFPTNPRHKKYFLKKNQNY